MKEYRHFWRIKEIDPNVRTDFWATIQYKYHDVQIAVLWQGGSVLFHGSIYPGSKLCHPTQKENTMVIENNIQVPILYTQEVLTQFEK